MLVVYYIWLLFFISLPDGYYYYWVDECICSSPDLTDTEYINTLYFNKELSVQFNSTVGKFIGFNEIGMSSADYWNSGEDLLVKRVLRDTLCKPGFEIMYTHFLDKTGEWHERSTLGLYLPLQLIWPQWFHMSVFYKCMLAS